VRAHAPHRQSRYTSPRTTSTQKLCMSMRVFEVPQGGIACVAGGTSQYQCSKSLDSCTGWQLLSI
jgi:hypothetical protein